MAENKQHFINFYKLITARFISLFGSYLSYIAINLYILEKTGSPTWVAILMGVRVLSGILFSPFGGYFVDKFNRKILMIFSDIILGVFILGLIFIPSTITIYYLVVLMSVLGVFSGLFDISLKTAIPSILETEDTLKANSILFGGGNFIFAVSSLLSIMVYGIFKNFNIIFMIDSISYWISASVLLYLKIKTAEKEHAVSKFQIKLFKFSEFTSVYKELLEKGVIKLILVFIVVLFLDAFGSASHNIGFPVFSKLLDPENPVKYYGVILFCWSIGNILGIYGINRLKYLQKLQPEILYLIFTGVMSIGMILIFQTKFMVSIVLSSLIAGIGDGTYQTYFTTYLQRIDDSIRGKIFALVDQVTKLGFCLGFILVPIVLDKIAISMTVAFFHLPTILIVIYYFLYFKIYKPEKSAGKSQIKNI